jgi:hypothetical protein
MSRDRCGLHTCENITCFITLGPHDDEPRLQYSHQTFREEAALEIQHNKYSSPIATSGGIDIDQERSSQDFG